MGFYGEDDEVARTVCRAGHIARRDSRVRAGVEVRLADDRPVAKQLESEFERITGEHALACSSATMAQLCGMRAWAKPNNVERGR